VRFARSLAAPLAAGLLLVLTACGSSPAAAPKPAATSGPASSRSPSPSPTSAAPTPTPAPPAAAAMPNYANPHGNAAIPAEARAIDISHADRVIGDGTPASCTSAAVVAAVAAGGIITFSCGQSPVTITLTATAKVVNTRHTVVLDGGGRVTLSGGGRRRILYMNTCDKAQGPASGSCIEQNFPQLTVQNLVFADANSTGDTEQGGGGGAIWIQGGRFKAFNTKFVRNTCAPTGPDQGGAAVRILEENAGPAYIVNSTFGGAPGQGGVCSNGGALSSIAVSWVVLNCVMSYNSAIGYGANPAQSGTPGGGSGGAVYNDGDTYTLRIAGTLIQHNHAREGGGAIFYVSNDHTGNLFIDGSTLSDNPSDGFHTAGYPGIFFIGQHNPTVTNSTLS
jgi:hypothetical protein